MVGLTGLYPPRVKNDADAEDILQDVWYQLSAVVNAERLTTGAWLYRVATNKIIRQEQEKNRGIARPELVRR